MHTMRCKTPFLWTLWWFLIVCVDQRCPVVSIMPRQKETYSYLDEWKSLWQPDLDALGGYNGATSDPTKIDPKVVEWAKHNCSGKPHFIKVINYNASANNMHGSRMCRRLTVPKPFVEAHFRELKRVVTLESNEDGRKWKVSFGEISSHPSWLQGWRRLAMDHDLQPGEVIVFILVENSHFRFARFDEHGNILSTPPSPGSIKSHPRTTWKSKRASNDLVSDCDTRSLSPGSDIGSPPSPEITCKRKRLGKVEEIESNIEKLRFNKELLLIHDSDEAASTSTAGNPSSVRSF